MPQMPLPTKRKPTITLSRLIISSASSQPAASPSKSRWIERVNVTCLILSTTLIIYGYFAFERQLKLSTTEHAEVQAKNIRLQWWSKIIERKDNSFSGFSNIIGDMAEIQKESHEINRLRASFNSSGNSDELVQCFLLSMKAMDKCNKILFINRRSRIDYYATIAEIRQIGDLQALEGVEEYISAYKDVDKCAFKVADTVKSYIDRIQDFTDGKSLNAIKNSAINGDGPTISKIAIREMQSSFSDSVTFIQASNHPGLVAMERFILRNAAVHDSTSSSAQTGTATSTGPRSGE